MISPVDAVGKIVVFKPPRRANGQPDFQLWDHRETLLAYQQSPAVFVGMLDLMPRSAVAAVLAPQFELTERVAKTAGMPPVFAVTRWFADVLLGEVHEDRWPGAASFTYGSREIPLEAPVRNVVAVIEGSDPTLRSEYVVLTAHTDGLGVAVGEDFVSDDSIFNGADDGGSGTVALLAIAKWMQEQPVKPKRSVLFVWTAA
jgi:hypothetical protein